MRLVCRGMIVKEIADAKRMSARTVEKHLERAKLRLNARNIVQAAVIFTCGKYVTTSRETP